MAIRTPIIDLSSIDFDRPCADLAEIRRHNPQRHEMEQLSAIVYEDAKKRICVGYKDVTDDEFWVRGHMPGMPLMPGVMMVECMAQLCAFAASRFRLLGDSTVVGFGGVEECHFREPVRPGDRLVLVIEITRFRPGRMVVCRFQGTVEGKLCLDGKLKGVALPAAALTQAGSNEADAATSGPAATGSP